MTDRIDEMVEEISKMIGNVRAKERALGAWSPANGVVVVAHSPDDYATLSVPPTTEQDFLDAARAVNDGLPAWLTVRFGRHLLFGDGGEIVTAWELCIERKTGMESPGTWRVLGMYHVVSAARLLSAKLNRTVRLDADGCTIFLAAETPEKPEARPAEGGQP